MKTLKTYLRLILACSLVCSAVDSSFADAPATEFFVIDSTKLAALASDDTKLDSLSNEQLSKISAMHGSYTGGLSMRTMTAKFRIDARFTSAFSEAKGPIGYNISASTAPATWDICSEQGSAGRTGNQFVTENWRTRSFAVVIRFLDLKH